MKVVVMGGTGLIGSKLVETLNAHGHDANPASLATGTNTLTNEGVDAAVAGADVLVDVTNSPSFADADVMNFFVMSTKNLLAAAKAAGVAHYVALSVVGCDRLPASGYFRAKVAQEQLIADSEVPYTIVRATQFFEFLTRIAESSVIGDQIRLSPAHFQPMAADDVAAGLGRASAGAPLGRVQEIGGPERVRMDELVSSALARAGDAREVVVDSHAEYFGAELADDSLVPGAAAILAQTTYAQWVDAAR